MNGKNKQFLSELQNMDEYEFEELVAGLWEKRGWSTTVTSASNDNGVDIIAEKHTPIHEKHLLQAKRYSSDNKVGSPDIQQYSSLKQQIENVDAVIVVTTSSFTSQAQQAARNLGVKTIDGDELISVINELGGETLNNNSNVAENPKFEHSIESISKKLKKCRDILNKGSEDIRADVIIEYDMCGYSVMPRQGEFKNVHMFLDSVREFNNEDRKKIISIANKKNLIVLVNDDDGVTVGKQGKDIPEVEEMLSVMKEILHSVFSVPSQKGQFNAGLDIDTY